MAKDAKQIIADRIIEAVARFHVIHNDLPAKAVIPQADYETFTNDVTKESVVDELRKHDPGATLEDVDFATYLRVVAGKDSGNLLIQGGKVTDVTLFKKVYGE